MDTQRKVQDLEPYVTYIAETMGFDINLINERTTINDFLDSPLWNFDEKSTPISMNEDGEKYLEHLSSCIGVPIKLGDHIYKIAAAFARTI